MWQGPLAQAHSERLMMLDRIVAALHEHYGDALLAVGLYGSLGRGDDGPYSDIELFCVVDMPGTDIDFEWVYGPGKAEVNIFGPDVVRARAQKVEDDWALAQGQLTRCRPLYGDLAFFEEIKQTALAPDKAAVDAMVTAIVVGELYEWMGKLRNARRRGDDSLARVACGFMEMLALLLGLVHRRLYTTGATMPAESLTLPDRPAGYDDACRMVMAGELSDPAAVAAALEATWAGLGPWLAQQGVNTETATAWPWDTTDRDKPETP